jgi:hypothetical protein
MHTCEMQPASNMPQGKPRRPSLGVSTVMTLASLGWDDPLNLSILFSGGKETNKDSPSNGE